MRNRRNQTWGDLANEMYLKTCSIQQNCVWGVRAHRTGWVDLSSVIHWDGFPRKSTTRGLRRFLKLAAQATNPQWAREPYWLQLYLQNTWASWEARRRFHLRIPTREADADRKIVQRAHVRKHLLLRTHYRNVYAWLYNPTKRP